MESGAAQTASELLRDQGQGAMQFAVDRIVAAIRASDEDRALHWSLIASEIERLRFARD